MSIKLENLSFIYESKQKKALNNVSISFKKNKIVGLIGFNGSGKTTIFNLLCNFLEEYEGKITFDGKKIDRSILKTISYLAAGAETKNSTKSITHLLAISSIYGVPRNSSINKIYKLAKELEFSQFLKTPIKYLSKGNQQKIKVIAALLNPNMKYLFLDEPFDGFDPIMIEKIKKIFMNLKGVTIIITSHRLEVIDSMTSEFFVLKNGVLVGVRKTNTDQIILSVNNEVDLLEIQKMNEVVKIIKGKNEHLIIIKNIDSFKKVNKKLIANSKYKFSSLSKKSLSEIIFREYVNE